MQNNRQNKLETLTAALKSGNSEARDLLVDELIGLSYSIANKFAKRFPQYAEELRAVAEEHLIVKLDQIFAGKTLNRDNNIGAFINASTVYTLLHWLKKQKKRTDRQLPSTYIEETGDDESFISNEPRVFNDALFNLLLDSVMESIDFSEREKLYIQLKLDGLTDKEAARVLGVKKERIAAFKYTLKRRICDFLQE